MNQAGMDDDDFRIFIDQLERFVRERLVPAERETERGNRVPPEVLADMRALGLFGITMPEAYGGAGMNVAQYVETIRVLSWASGAFRAIIAINIGMACSALLNFGTPSQKSEWLPRLAAGDIASFALTEPDSGSDAAALRTRAVRDGEHYVLNGTKRFITNAPFADLILVMARTQPANLPKNAHVSAFLVPAATAGLRIGKAEEKLGQAGSQVADVVLEDVRVPASALLGGMEGTGFQAAMRALDTGRLCIAAAATGFAARILDGGIGYATARQAFGQPIANFQLIQAMLADSQAELYAAECMIRDAAQRADRGQRISLEASCSKMFASEMCGRVADRVVQIHGGAGYMKEYDAERFFRDARIFRIYEGTTQIQQLVIAKNLLRAYAAAH